MMSHYLLRRVLSAIPLLLGVVGLVFVMVRVAIPGDPAAILAGDRATPEALAALRSGLGLDRPLWEQLLIFAVGALRGDLGRSTMFNQPVGAALAAAFPLTLTLATLSVAIGTALGLAAGSAAALRRGSWFDTACMATATMLYSVPIFWLGLLLVMVFSVQLRLLPVQGADSWRHLVLPVLALAAQQAPIVARLTRASMVEVLTADYVRTARAKGVTERLVLTRHALRNALLPVVTVVGLSFGHSLGGAVIVESIFGLPGIGTLAIRAIENRDYPLIQGVVLSVAVAFVLVNLVVDALYAWLDPRIRYV